MAGDDAAHPSELRHRQDETAAPLSVDFDAGVYSVEVVVRAAYWLDRLATFDISTPSPQTIRVTVFPRRDSGETSEPDFRQLLRSRVVDEAVRSRVREETRDVRELILAKAFSAAGLLDDPPPGDDRDPVEAGDAKRVTVNPTNGR